MNELHLNLITSAVKIQMQQGTPIDEAISRYTKLTDSEKAVIKDRIVRS